MSVTLTLQNHCGFEVSLVRTVDLKEYPRGMQAWPSRWLRGNGCLLSLMTGSWILEDPQGGRRELSPASCTLIPKHVLMACTRMHTLTCTHTHMNK